MFAAQIDNAIENLLWNTRETGGDTQSARGDKVPDTGYMVGGMTDSLIFDAMLIRDPGHFHQAYNMIMRWMVAENFAMATRANVFLGGWIDQETGIAFIDLSEHFPSDMRANAIHQAISRDEIAIWDLEKGEEIRIS
jgi:hypothetical protein